MLPQKRKAITLQLAPKVCLLVTVVGTIILVASVLITNKPPTYDELNILREVNHLKEKGLSLDFLNNYGLGHGPLPVFLQYMLEPLTSLKPPGIRLVNLGFLFALAITQFFILRRLGSNSVVSSSLSIVAAPMIWVMSGMALSEMPAMALAALALLLLLVSVEDVKDKTSMVCAIVGGLALGVSIVGRQPFLTILLALPVLAPGGRKSSANLILFCLAALVLPTILFSVWGGLTSPGAVSNVVGISFYHGALSLGYGAILILIWAPRYFHLNLKIVSVPALHILPQHGCGIRRMGGFEKSCASISW